ncbi:phosphomannomutase [Anaerosporomusa subterranea]|uniref:Phosphomannomutase n=1 Tax=Anaerosporomusa subterranea TaxID=1794912 RepID=A0A154BVP3_ANASB|nr:phosphomannomutase/phosphoglucomutase [Anaerosporomusa subterranea]KYZ78056.1 phosphomannomutase [Anaerosporomusa subterranea]
MSIFKACDIRGVAGSELTDVMTRKIALAVGTKLAGKIVVVGGDIRLSTPRLQKIFIDALVESGCQVMDIGTVATPVFYFALKQCHADGGVMITASHNPARYNGFKLVFGPNPASEEDITEIGSLVAAGDRVSGNGSVQAISVREEYFSFTAAKALPGRLKVVVDAGNGATAPFAARLFRRLGYDVVELYGDADGSFPNRPPNPALAPNLAALAELVRQSGAALGVAFDGDGDRVGFVDETGRAVDNDDILVLLARCYLAQTKGTIVYDAKCSMVVPEEITKAGGRPVMARAGHTFSKAAFQREQALLAGEISGHFFLSELGYDDAMFAGLKVAALVEQQGSLAAQIDSIPNYLLTPDVRVPYLGNDKEIILEQAAQKLAQYQPNRIDGVRIDFADGWAMIRSSVTEPLFTLRFEAKTANRLREIAKVLLSALPQELQQDIATALPAELCKVR